MHLRLRLLLVGLASVLGLAGAVATTAAASTKSGTVRVWVTPGKGAVDHILLTGLIADQGTATSIDKDGKVDANGAYVRVKLAHGTFEVNAVALNQSLNKLAPTVDKTTCTAWATGSGNVTLFNGGGAYAGISGTIRMTTSFAVVAKRYPSGAKKGQCNLNGQPIAQFEGSLTGVGKASL